MNLKGKTRLQKTVSNKVEECYEANINAGHQRLDSCENLRGECYFTSKMITARKNHFNLIGTWDPEHRLRKLT